jgi:hypothetical protein
VVSRCKNPVRRSVISSNNQNLIIMAQTKSTGKTTKPKKERPPSPYGSTLEILSKNPDLTKAQIIAPLKAKKFDTDACNGAVTTGIAQFKKIYKLLGENDHLKK